MFNQVHLLTVTRLYSVYSTDVILCIQCAYKRRLIQQHWSKPLATIGLFVFEELLNWRTLWCDGLERRYLILVSFSSSTSAVISSDTNRPNNSDPGAIAESVPKSLYMPHNFSREVPTSRKHRADPAGVRRVPTGERRSLARSLRGFSQAVSPATIVDPAVYIRPADRRPRASTLRVYDVRGKTAVNAAARRKGRARGAHSGVLGYCFPRRRGQRAPGAHKESRAARAR